MGLIVTKARIMWRNILLRPGVGIAVTSSAPNFPPVMLLDPWPGMKWKSTGLADQEFVITLPERQAIAALGIINHNLDYKGTISLTADGQTQTWTAWEAIHRFGTTPFGQTPVGGFPSRSYLEGLNVGPVRMVYPDPPAYTTQYKITLSNPTNTDGFLSAGVIYLGSYMETPVMFDKDYSLQWDELSEEESTSSGQEPTILHPRRRRLPMRLSNMNRDFAQGPYADFLATVGTSKPFLFDAFPFGQSIIRYRHLMYAKRHPDSGGLEMGELMRGNNDLVLREMM